MAKRVALVSGAGSGIGAATTARLLERGYRVIATGRRRERLEALAANYGADCAAVTLDVADPRSIATLPVRLPRDWGPVDTLINNAGSDVGGRTPFAEGSIDDWASTLETNLVGTMRLTHLLLPSMLQANRGDIVLMSSLVTRAPHPGVAAYTVSKYGIHGFATTLRADYRETRLRITEIQVSAVRTDFAETRWRGDRERASAFYRSIPAVLEADDLARTIMWTLDQPPAVTIGEVMLFATTVPPV
jgi:3-hydroxy acid dehydrogenase/malonic semialdehyde reductase